MPKRSSKPARSGKAPSLQAIPPAALARTNADDFARRGTGAPFRTPATPPQPPLLSSTDARQPQLPASGPDARQNVSPHANNPAGRLALYAHALRNASRPDALGQISRHMVQSAMGHPEGAQLLQHAANVLRGGQAQSAPQTQRQAPQPRQQGLQLPGALPAAFMAADQRARKAAGLPQRGALKGGKYPYSGGMAAGGSHPTPLPGGPGRMPPRNPDAMPKLPEQRGATSAGPWRTG